LEAFSPENTGWLASVNGMRKLPDKMIAEQFQRNDAAEEAGLQQERSKYEAHFSPGTCDRRLVSVARVRSGAWSLNCQCALKAIA